MFGKKKEEVENGNKDTEAHAEVLAKMPEAPVVLSKKEMKKLKNNGYEKASAKYDKVFVIKNKRTGMIVELKAASAYQASGFIGWRPRHTILLKEKNIKAEKAIRAKIDSANKAIEDKKANCPALQ